MQNSTLSLQQQSKFILIAIEVIILINYYRALLEIGENFTSDFLTLIQEQATNL